MLFLLYGEDSFSSKEKLKQLQGGFSQKNPSAEMAFFDFSEKKDLLESFLRSFNTRGLFSNKKMIVSENLLKEIPATSQKYVLEKLKDLKDIENNPEIVVIFREDGHPKKNLSLFKFLEKSARKQFFPLLDSKGLEKWLTGYLLKNYPNVSLSSGASSLLISYVGNDLFLLRNELEKVANFKLQGQISEDDIKVLVNSKIDSTVFEAIEALAGENKSKALKLLHEQISKGEDPYYILSMYVYQLRTLLKIGDFYWQGMQGAPQISQAAGLHPFVVQKSLPQLRNLTQEKLKSMFSQLAEIDLAAKTGKTDLILALDNFIVSL